MKKFLFVANRFDSSPAGGTALCHAHYEILRNSSVWGGVQSYQLSQEVRR